MSDPIQEALALSRQAQQATSTALAATTSVQGAVAVPQKLTMETMSAGGMSVDKWFKVTEDGIKIGDSALIVGDLLATLEMTEGSGFILKYAIKGGNPAQYAYTCDNANAAGGGSWDAAQARIRALAPAAAPYRCVDLPFTLIGEVKDMKNVVVGKAGDTIGYTTSTTNWANWQAFYKEVADAGLMGQTVTVKLTAQPRVNKAGNKWGVIQFELQQQAE